DSAALVRADDPGAPLGIAGSAGSGRPSISVPAGEGLVLVAHGPTLFGEDRALLSRLATAAARAWEAQQLMEEAARARDLAAADRVRSALLAAVGHDLRTPLAGIKAAVSSLRADDVEWSPAEEAELLATIEQGADRLDALIANLLDLSRLQTGSLAVRAVPLAVDEVVARALLHEREADVAIEIPDDLPLVLSDPGLLERVVANVVDNARRYSPPGQPVRIRASVRGAVVVLEVVDHGPGVPEGDWSRLFVPFQRLDDRSAEAHVGLGLAIAQGFAEAMGAAIAPTRTPGGGLTMTLTLPLAAP
ncbi:MAG TPA: ATP-binding protein, partial [Actinotalea sp.]|nr:ATP-binding protein [Actinotalea sp.]